MNTTKLRAHLSVAQTRGHLANQLSTFFACYALALRGGADFAADAKSTVCAKLSGAPGCGAADWNPLAPRLIAERTWWDGAGGAAAVEILRTQEEGVSCGGYRQAATYFANDAVFARRVRNAIKWRQPIVDKADAIWNKIRVAEPAYYVALYRPGDAYAHGIYASCLPDALFYRRVATAFRAMAPRDARVVFVTSSHAFDSAAQNSPFRGLSVVAIDDDEPSVILAALSRFSAASFSGRWCALVIRIYVQVRRCDVFLWHVIVVYCAETIIRLLPSGVANYYWPSQMWGMPF